MIIIIIDKHIKILIIVIIAIVVIQILIVAIASRGAMHPWIAVW